jgi:hypothetical protein
MQKITKFLAFAGLAFGLATCASADITWTFNTTTFCYNCEDNPPLETFNDIAAGSYFTTNNAGTAITGFDITVEGTNSLADNVYTTANSITVFPDAFHLDFYDTTAPDPYLNLYLASPGITSAGGTVDLLQGDFGETSNATITCNGCGTLVSGSINGSTVPEPRLGAFLLIGLAGLGFFARRTFANRRA